MTVIKLVAAMSVQELAGRLTDESLNSLLRIVQTRVGASTRDLLRGDPPDDLHTLRDLEDVISLELRRRTSNGQRWP